MAGRQCKPFVHAAQRRLADSNCCKASERNVSVNAPYLLACTGPPEPGQGTALTRRGTRAPLPRSCAPSLHVPAPVVTVSQSCAANAAAFELFSPCLGFVRGGFVLQGAAVGVGAALTLTAVRCWS